MVHPPPETTADSLLSGRLRLHQAARGHRAGSDALMLAALTPPETRGLILDIGASAGAVGLVAALRAATSLRLVSQISVSLSVMAGGAMARGGRFVERSVR